MVTRVPYRSALGAFEPVIFPEFDNAKVVAKIDTGAYTGALHCTKIEERKAEGGSQLVFSPLESDVEVVRDEYVTKHIKSSNGKRQKRHIISTKIIIQNREYELFLSLANRSDMKHQVLIGRSFLKRNHFIVDPQIINR
jgi:hypothetical protein